MTLPAGRPNFLRAGIVASRSFVFYIARFGDIFLYHVSFLFLLIFLFIDFFLPLFLFPKKPPSYPLLVAWNIGRNSPQSTAFFLSFSKFFLCDRKYFLLILFSTFFSVVTYLILGVRNM